MLSRIADSLFWMARYMARAEDMARLLDVTYHMLLEQAQDSYQLRWEAVITITEQTWVALRSQAGAGDQGGPAGSTTRVLAALRDVPTVVDERGQAWPASEVARALCDCALTRAVIGAKRETLDVGRDSRLFQRTHWLALCAAGLRTCAVEGCGMPLAYCELHHLRWWDRDGGLTNLANCAPYCSYHHHEIHRRDLRVTRRTDGGFDHHDADGRRYGGTPPGGDAMPAPPQDGGALSTIASGNAVPPAARALGTAPRCAEAPRLTDDPPVDLLALLTG